MTKNHPKRLVKNASRTARIRYIQDRLNAARKSLRVGLENAWFAGSELTRLKSDTGLSGRLWNKFVLDTFGLKETQAFHLQRITKGFKSIDDIPDGISSIRAAIKLFQAEKSNTSKSSPDVKNTAMLPLASLVPVEHRGSLRSANRDLVEIAYNDPATFAKVCAYIENKRQIARRASSTAVLSNVASP